MVACWGYENRTAAVRIPGGPPSQRRIEHRVAGADTNAYLVMAAILGAVLAGIEGNMQPPNPIRSSAYGTGHADMPRLPLSWQDSLDVFISGKMLDEFIPGILRDMVIKTKQQEMQRFTAMVTPFEYQSYLDQV
jgi:glutamine synthetase